MYSIVKWHFSNSFLVVIQFKILILSLTVSSSLSRWNDTYDLYDLANLRKDYLIKYCSQVMHGKSHDVEGLPELDNFLNCTKPGLLFPHIQENSSVQEVYEKHREPIHNWCLSWPIQRECELQHEKFVDPCFSVNPSASVGFDIITAFFESACTDTKKLQNSSAIAYLAVIRKNLRRWWFQERDIVSCFSERNLEYYKRDVNLVLNCIKYQLRYRSCPNNKEKCEDLIQVVEDSIKSSYKSSGYVFLNSYNLSIINVEKFPLASVLSSNLENVGVVTRGCKNGNFAYIAFFSLLAIVLITFGLLVSSKVKCINFHCYHRYQAPTTQGHQELVQHDGEGSNSIEM